MVSLGAESITDRSCGDDDLFSRIKYIRSFTRRWKRACCHIDACGGLVRTENHIPSKRMLVHLQIRLRQSLL